MGEPRTAPPAGEEIHLPGPSLTPLLNAAGITLALLGLTSGWYFLVAGLLIFFLTLVRWVRDTSRDIEALPAEHRH
jgi:hypothetical protein